jgi:hypothetical protein
MGDSLGGLIRVFCNYVITRFSQYSAFERGDAPIERERRIIAWVLAIVFLGLPAGFILFFFFFTDLFFRVFG